MNGLQQKTSPNSLLKQSSNVSFCIEMYMCGVDTDVQTPEILLTKGNLNGNVYYTVEEIRENGI